MTIENLGMETTPENKKHAISDILILKVSYQPNAWSMVSKEVSIKEVFEEIKNEIHIRQVSYLRSLLKNNDIEKYKIHKRNLPAVTFCGTFEKQRLKEALKSYNNIIVIDIDKLNIDELLRVKECFLKDDFVFAFWESPSQQGIKGLVHFNYNSTLIAANIDEVHRGAFKKLAKYFSDSSNVELDISGSDTTRLCFLSYDPNIVIKKGVIPFEVANTDIEEVHKNNEETKNVKKIYVSNRDILFNPKNKNDSRHRKTIQAIIKFLEKRELSITHSYEEWYRIALAIANTFTYDIGEKYFQKLSSMDKEKYNKINCNHMLLNCYENHSGAISFRTIEYFAKQKGYINKKIREESTEAAIENASQVSTSTNGSLPEVLKSD